MVPDQASAMSTRKRLVLALAGAMVVCLSMQGAESEPRHDGKLWLQMDWNEREAFNFGYNDCEVDVLGNRGWPDVENLEREIFEYYYYRKQESDLRVPIRVVLKKKLALHRNDPPRKPTKEEVEDPPEVWPEKHGFLDGDYWGTEEKRGSQLAFVRGQLECYQHEPKSKLHFSKPAAEYVRLISEWYAGEGRDSPRSKEKIPEVLLRFADGKKTPRSRAARPATTKP